MNPGRNACSKHKNEHIKSLSDTSMGMWIFEYYSLYTGTPALHIRTHIHIHTTYQRRQLPSQMIINEFVIKLIN